MVSARAMGVSGVFLAVLTAFGTCLGATALVEAWSRTYDSPPIPGAWDTPHTALWDSQNNGIVVGTTSGNDGSVPLALKLRGSDGTLLWKTQMEERPDVHFSFANAALDPTGNLVVCGNWSGGEDPPAWVTLKFSGSDGSEMWRHELRSPPQRYGSANSMAMDSEGHVFVTGHYPDSKNSKAFIPRTLKLDARDGRVLWDVAQFKSIEDYGNTRISVTHSGDPIVGRLVRTPSNGSLSKIHFARFSGRDGRLIWEREFVDAELAYEAFAGFELDPWDDLLLVGRYHQVSDFSGRTYLAKWRGVDGTILWEQRLDGPNQRGHVVTTLTVDSMGHVAIAGTTPVASVLPFRTRGAIYLARFDGFSGMLIWDAVHDTPGWGGYNHNEPVALRADSEDNIILLDISVFSDWYPGLVKFAAADGSKIWEARWRGWATTPPNEGRIAISSNNELLLAGNTLSQEFVASRFSMQSGAQVWDQPYDGPANGNDFAAGMAFDSGGNVVLIGTSNRQVENDVFTIKYAAGNGATLWEAHTQGTVWYFDFLAKPVIDAHDDVYVASSTPNRYHTVKYSGRDGRVLWENFQLGAAFETPETIGIRLDPAGDILGAAYIRNNVSGSLVFKLSGSTGEVLWRVLTYGPANRGIRFKTFAVDAQGDLVLLAEKDGFWTAKFKGTDGRILWSKSYGQADTGYPVVPDSLWSGGGPEDLSFDHLGNVILTGIYGDGNSYNLRTIKYAGNDGTRLWHAGYDGPASGQDRAYAVTCDETGNVLVVGQVEVTSGYSELRGIQHAADTGAVLREIPVVYSRTYGPTKGPAGPLYFWNEQSVLRFAATGDNQILPFQPTPGLTPGFWTSSLAVDSAGPVAITSVTRFGRESHTKLYRSVEVPALSLTVDPSGSRRLQVTEVTQPTLSVLRSVDLKSWEFLGAITNASAGNALEFMDSTPLTTRAFYRIQVP